MYSRHLSFEYNAILISFVVAMFNSTISYCGYVRNSLNSEVCSKNEDFKRTSLPVQLLVEVKIVATRSEYYRFIKNIIQFQFLYQHLPMNHLC